MWVRRVRGSCVEDRERAITFWHRFLERITTDKSKAAYKPQGEGGEERVWDPKLK
jgi:hypothetical protein